MAGRVDTLVRCWRGQLLIDRVTVIDRGQVIRVVMPVVANTRLGVLRRNGRTMIATTEHPVREHVHCGQDGDE